MPSELDRFLWLNNPLPSSDGLPGTEEVRGNPAIPGEILIALEAGVRLQWNKHFSLDVAGFSNHYTRLVKPVIRPPYVELQPALMFVLPASWAGTGEAISHGIEVAASWSPARTWRLQFSYAFDDPRFPKSAVTTLVPPAGTDWGTSDHTTGVRSSWEVTRRWSLDCSLYAAQGIKADEGGPVPAYARVDLRIARKLSEGGELSGGVRNLFDAEHLEFLAQDNLVASYIKRAVYLKIAWRF
jgi:outer membrane receptor protein involved in Fe transport